MIDKRAVPVTVPLFLSALIASPAMGADVVGETVADNVTYDYHEVRVDVPAVPDDGDHSVGLFVSSYPTYHPVTIQINDALKITATNGTTQGGTTGFSTGQDFTVTGKTLEIDASGVSSGSGAVHGFSIHNGVDPSTPAYANIEVDNLVVKADAPNSEARGFEIGQGTIVNMRGKSLDVQVSGDYATGIFDWHYGDPADRVTNMNYDTVTVTAQGNGRENEWYAYNGIWASDGEVNINARKTTVVVQNTNSADTHALVANGANGAINVTGDVELRSTNRNGLSYAARAWNGAKIRMGEYGVDDGVVRVVQGNLLTQQDGTEMTMSFTNDASSLTGNARTYGGATNLTVTNGAHWNMAGNSTISKLYAANGGVISLNYIPDVFQTLTVDRLQGEGANFHLTVDIDADAADTVKIGNGSGAHQILVHSTGAEPQRQRMNTYLVEQKAGSATFTLANRAGLVDAGVYVYDLHHETNATTGTGTGWYLHRYDREDPEYPDPGTPEEPGQPDPGSPEEPGQPNPSTPEEPGLPILPEPPLSPTAEAVVTLSGVSSSYSMWHSQLADLRKRLGEVRDDTALNGVWFRTFAQKDKLDGLYRTRFSQDVYGASLGYDRAIRTDDANRWLFGVKGSYTKADQDANGIWGGSGKNESFGAALYATWTHVDGWYADGIVTWDRYRQEIKDHMLDGTPVSGHFNRYSAGASIEGGRKIALSGDFFIEPQLQLSYFWLKGKNFTMNNGMEVETENADVVTGRAGVVIGKQWQISPSRWVQPYLKGGVIHEFTGDDKTVINTIHTFDGDIAGTRGYYGVGLDWRINGQARLYGEVERQDGDHIKSLWNATVGLRVAF